jgi:tRNA(fMet)-specific endonuclease VapC
MKLSYLIDTDWVIHYLNGTQKFVEIVRKLRDEGIGMSIISLAEVYEGVYYSTDPKGNEMALQDFLAKVLIIEIDEEICKIFGRERGKLRKEKKLFGDMDLLIASTSIRHNLPLLTNNRQHYERIEKLELISI